MRLISKSEVGELSAGSVLFDAGQTPSYAHFLTSGLATFVTPLENERFAVSDLVGREGIPEALHVLGPSKMVSRCSIQVPTTALRMTFKTFQH
jgi:CRP-like cAMP-binding protein